MFAAAPVYSPYGDVIAVLALRMDPEQEFSHVFSVARMGETGEAYAFDRRGVMLSNSRFLEELKEDGLIPNKPHASSILAVQLVDPGHEIKSDEATNNATAGKPLPLTRMAASATTEWDGYDAEGYRIGSPITFAGQLKGKLLVVHGSGDDNVHFQGTERLVNALVAANKQFTMMDYPNRTHCICEGPGTTRHLFELLESYLHQHLPTAAGH